MRGKRHKSLRCPVPRGVAPRNGLVAEWLFDGGVADTSGHGRDLLDVNNITYTDDDWGQNGRALLGEKLNERRAGRDADWANVLGRSFTISFWVRVDNFAEAYSRVFAFTDTNEAFVVSCTELTYSGGYFSYMIRDASQQYSRIDFEAGGAGWYHIACIRSNDVVQLRVNNQLAAEGFVSGVGTPNLERLTLLSGWDGITNGYAQFRHFSGAIALFRIYDRALTSPELDNLYFETSEADGQGFTILDRGLTAKYYFADNLLDSSLKNNHATDYGTIAEKGIYGEDKRARGLDGEAAYFICPDAVLDVSKDFSVLLFVRIDEVGGSILYNVLESGALSGIGLYSTNGGKMGFLSVAEETDGVWSEFSEVHIGKWRFFSIVCKNRLVTIRENNHIACKRTLQNYTESTLAPVRIGQSDNSNFLRGAIARLYFYDKALPFELQKLIAKELFIDNTENNATYLYLNGAVGELAGSWYVKNTTAGSLSMNASNMTIEANTGTILVETAKAVDLSLFAKIRIKVAFEEIAPSMVWVGVNENSGWTNSEKFVQLWETTTESEYIADVSALSNAMYFQAFVDATAGDGILTITEISLT